MMARKTRLSRRQRQKRIEAIVSCTAVSIVGLAFVFAFGAYQYANYSAYMAQFVH